MYNCTVWPDLTRPECTIVQFDQTFQGLYVQLYRLTKHSRSVRTIVQLNQTFKVNCTIVQVDQTFALKNPQDLPDFTVVDLNTRGRCSGLIFSLFAPKLNKLINLITGCFTDSWWHHSLYKMYGRHHSLYKMCWRQQSVYKMCWRHHSLYKMYTQHTKYKMIINRGVQRN